MSHLAGEKVKTNASGGPTLWGIINPPRTLRSVFWSPSLGSPVTPAPKGTRPAQRYQAGSLFMWSRNARLDTAGPARLATPADVTGDPRHHFCVNATAATLPLLEKVKSRSLEGMAAPCTAAHNPCSTSERNTVRGVLDPPSRRRAKPTNPGWQCQVERFLTTAGAIRLDTARPGWFRKAL